jgi:hypothetical protein
MSESFRLTREMRVTLTERILAHRFKEREDALKYRFATLAIACYKKQYNAKQIALMESLPEGWLHTNTGLNVAFGEASDGYAFLSFSPASPGAYMSRDNGHTEFRFPRCDKGQCRLKLPDNHALSTTYFKLHSQWEELKKERSALYNEVRGTLGSFSATSTLLDKWPEVAPFLKGLAPVVSKNLPAIVVKDLNKRLGLTTVVATA